MTNLPFQLDAFVGRTAELQIVKSLLLGTTCRLLTLTGPGGIGKTRLAIEAGSVLQQHFRDGIIFVALQSVTEPAHLPFILCDALDLTPQEHELALDQIIEYLRHRQMLLIIDNFEHMLGAAQFILALLKEVGDVKLLVTSREVLGIHGEQVVELRGLSLPTNDEGHHQGDALHLFVTRARQIRHELSLETYREEITRICRLVEGMPLAIELAAAWVRTLSLKLIASEIEQNIDFLSSRQRDVPERHRTMRAVFDHSWRLLSLDEQAVLRRLSIFRGPFSAEAAVTTAETSFPLLSALVDKSLLRVDEHEEYALHELLRQFAEEKLKEDTDDFHETKTRHSEFYLTLLKQLDPIIKSDRQIFALDTIERAAANIRHAWLCAAEEHRSDLVQDALECLTLYYQMRCRQHEGYDMFTRAASYFHDDAPLYGWLTISRCWFTGFGVHVQEGERHALMQEAADSLRKYPFRDRGAMAIGALLVASVVEESVADEILRAYQAKGERWGAAWAFHHKCATARIHGNQAAAKQFAEDSLAIFRQIGDHWGATWPQGMLGVIAAEQGRFRDALEFYLARLYTCEALGDIGGVTWSLQELARVTLELDDLEQAHYYSREALRLALDISSSLGIAQAILRIAHIHQRTGNAGRGAVLCMILRKETDAMTVIGRHINHALDQMIPALSAEELHQAALQAEIWTMRQLGLALLEEQAKESHDRPASNLTEALSPRELEVLQLAADGLSNREIAARLVVTVGTVKKHLNNIFGKLGVDRRTHAIARAHESGLIA